MQVAELTESLKSLPNECMIAASFMTYLSNAAEDVRKETIQEWSKALGVRNFDLKRFANINYYEANRVLNKMKC